MHSRVGTGCVSRRARKGESAGVCTSVRVAVTTIASCLRARVNYRGIGL